jgi:hypothetical protein
MCDFDFVSYFLASIYFLLLLFVIRYLIQLTFHSDSPREAQRFFLLLVSFQCLGRCLYFFMWPAMGDKCSPTASADNFLWINGLGNLPPALFIAAFSILVFTFARIYHCVLLSGIGRERTRFSVLYIILLLLNAIASGSEIGEWASEDSASHEYFSQITVYSVAGVSLVLALMFWLYGTLLYKQVERVLLLHLPAPEMGEESNRGDDGDRSSAPDSPNYGPVNSQPIKIKDTSKQPLLEADRNVKSASSLSPVYLPRPEFLSPSDGVDVLPLHYSVLEPSAAATNQSMTENNRSLYSDSSNQLRSPANSLQMQTSSDYSNSVNYIPPVNPMRKLAIIAGICTLCLTLRTILLLVIVVLGSVFDWSLTLLYFSLSEIIPLLLMLKVFDTPSPVVPLTNEQDPNESFQDGDQYKSPSKTSLNASVSASPAQSSGGNSLTNTSLPVSSSGAGNNFALSIPENAGTGNSELDAERLRALGNGREAEYLNGLDDIES